MNFINFYLWHQAKFFNDFFFKYTIPILCPILSYTFLLYKLLLLYIITHDVARNLLELNVILANDHYN